MATSTLPLATKFQELAGRWKDATEFLSSPADMINDPAYREIIAMGGPVIPLILTELKMRPDFWFAALREITGEDPVPPEARGDVRAMSDAWLKWGRLHEPRG
jgi:hypothetical protein